MILGQISGQAQYVKVEGNFKSISSQQYNLSTNNNLSGHANVQNGKDICFSIGGSGGGGQGNVGGSNGQGNIDLNNGQGNVGLDKEEGKEEDAAEGGLLGALHQICDSLIGAVEAVCDGIFGVLGSGVEADKK